MTTMQDTLLERIEQVITDAGLQPTIQRAWANTGTVYAMDGLTTRRALSYAF
jgi:hypothetical protein